MEFTVHRTDVSRHREFIGIERRRVLREPRTIGLAVAVRCCPVSLLHNWLKAQEQGRLSGQANKPVSAEQMEISRLRAELARVKMERDILKKATAYFAKESM